MGRRRIILIGSSTLAVAVGVGAFMIARYEPGADWSYDTRVPAPALNDRHPRVLFDQGHNNIHSGRGRYGPFVALISADGCRVKLAAESFTPATLATVDILVVVNATGPGNDRSASAFTPLECDAVKSWVQAGGALLLVADHHPCGEAAAALASRFGVEMSGGWTVDEPNARPDSGDAGQIVFTRSRGQLADHPIINGRSTVDAVAVVETFTGQSLKGPSTSASIALLRLADSAIDSIPVSSQSRTEGSKTITTFETRDTTAAGRCQGLALRWGAGRVVVLGEAAMLTAQISDTTGERFGMNAGNNDNRMFALNIVRWLAAALDE
jgi:hypothetical protein